MRIVLLTACAVLGLGLLVLWATGGLDGLSTWAEAAQRRFQASMAQGLRALRAGEPGALATLWGLCFAYGFVHAVGPGHGKFLLGAYGAGTQVSLARLSTIGLAASLAQGASAVGLVYAGVGLFNASREALQLTGEVWLNRAGLVAIALIGAWLLWRGLRKLILAPRPVAQIAGHDHGADHLCESCGHSHAPSPAQVAQAQGWRDVAALIGAIAIRPCTGALFLLILTWRMGLVWQGIAGALIMALGTASVTMSVAALSVLARDGALAWGARWRSISLLAPMIEMLAGAFVLVLALNMLKIF